MSAIGAGMNQTAMLADFARDTDVDILMVAGRYTLLDQTSLDELLPVAQQRGVAIVAAGVFNSGLLARAAPPDDATYDAYLIQAHLSAKQSARAAELAVASDDFG